MRDPEPLTHRLGLKGCINAARRPRQQPPRLATHACIPKTNTRDVKQMRTEVVVDNFKGIMDILKKAGLPILMSWHTASSNAEASDLKAFDRNLGCTRAVVNPNV
jgi:hypothetical protein